MHAVLSGAGRVRPCLAILTVLAIPIRLDDMSLRLDGRSPGMGKGCCVVLAETTDATLESWLGVHEKPPPTAPPPAAPPPAALSMPAPPATVAQKAGAAEMDWRLMPFLAVQASGGGAGQPTLLSIAVASPYGQPNAQHEAVTYVLISNLPAKTTLSHGREVGDGMWQVPLEGLSGLTMTMPAEIVEPVTVLVTAVTDHGGGLVARQAKELTLPAAQAVDTVAAVPADPPTNPPTNPLADPGGAPPPAQGGSSHGAEAVAFPTGSQPVDSRSVGSGLAEGKSDSVAAEFGNPSPPAPQQPENAPVDSGPAPPPAPIAGPGSHDPAAREPADLKPAIPKPAITAATPVPAAEPTPEPVTEPPSPPAVTPTATQAAPAAPVPAPVSAPVSVSMPAPPPASTVTVATIPAVTAPPAPPERRQQDEKVVLRPAKPPAAIPEATLMKRGDDLFAQGDLAAARLYYEMAAASGSAKAALALGRTHDPLVHERLRVRGLSPDPEQAAAWYRRAIANGSADAEQQLQKLTVWLAGRSR